MASLRCCPLRSSIALLRENLERGDRVVLEGTQGFGLSLLHSGTYPFCTSRDTTASGFISEAGLSPFDVDQIVM
ncbi:MAG TPA: adenylosuccinate synthetase, partial [Burkholderiales bacterium]|nr:adenylosuccinate synthetase [Burkholderiales bacterium]